MPTVHDDEAATWSSVHLDAVRGLAAVMVMTFHVKSFFFSSLTDPTEGEGIDSHIAAQTSTHVAVPAAPAHQRANMGNTPVMMFFVLSGYLVGGSVLRNLRKQRWSWTSYLTKRLTRLWVVLIPAVLVGVALDQLGPRLFPAPGGIYFGHIGYVYPHYLQDFRLITILGNFAFLQGIFANTPGTNGALWSLANEFWYYILFPAMIVPFWLRKPLWIKAAYLSFVIGFLAMVWTRTDPASLKNIPLLFPIWILGAILSQIPIKVKRPARYPLTALMIVIVIAGTALLRRYDLGIHPSQWIISTLFTGLLYMLLQYPTKARDGIYRRVSGFFSRISYSLYLMHMPLGAFLAAWLVRPTHLRTRTPMNLAIYVGFCSLIVLITYGFYRLFEANTDRARAWVTRERSAVRAPEMVVPQEQ